MNEQEMKDADNEFGRRIIYGHLSSCGIDNLVKRAKQNQEREGNTNYTDLAEYLASFPL